MNDAMAPARTYNLNQGQQGAADAFMEFLFTDEQEFIISGAAGVGKTYLMNYIVDETMPRYEEMCGLLGEKAKFDSVVMTATTNKAAEVLSKSIGRPAQTVHSFFNLTVKDDYKTGKSIISRTKMWKPHHNKIIFVDECSMVDSTLWGEIQAGTVNCKIVYVGDRHQLAPVQEDLSPVYKHKTAMAELTQPVRNSGQPALMAVCNQLRQTVDGGQFMPIRPVPGVIDHVQGNQMQAEIFTAFQNQTHAARILAYTNKRVIEYNDHIRTIRQLPNSYQVGEFLVAASVIHTRNGNIPVEAEIEVLRNSGPDKLLIDPDHDVWLDIEHIDIKDSFGDEYRDIPVMTNREHFEQLIKYYASIRDWGRYFALKNEIADLRPRDAATVHKSQGSTYDTVFIDLGNISTCHQPKMAARMLYVAFSRARNRIVLYGDLATKYGGLALH